MKGLKSWLLNKVIFKMGRNVSRRKAAALKEMVGREVTVFCGVGARSFVRRLGYVDNAEADSKGIFAGFYLGEVHLPLRVIGNRPRANLSFSVNSNYFNELKYGGVTVRKERPARLIGLLEGAAVG